MAEQAEQAAVQAEAPPAPPSEAAEQRQDGDSRVSCISCGSSHSVAVVDDDCVVAFGRGEDGQLGLGDAIERLEPHVVSTLVGQKIDFAVCGAEYTLAVNKANKEVYSWGWGDFGRLGHGDCADVFLPQSIKALSGIRIDSIACGDTHTMALTSEGRLFSFGRNQNGQLGVGTLDDAFSPMPISILEGVRVVSVACGAEHTLCAGSEGEMYAWGWGRYGNLGNGECKDRAVPTKVIDVDGVRMARVACGWRHSCSVSEQGDLYTFGWSRYGQLGHGDHADRLSPTKVEGLEGQKVQTIAGGWRHTTCTTRCGRVYAWGWNKFGQLGLGHRQDANAPQEVKGIDGPVSLIACGWRHTLAVTSAGDVYSWGRGVNGQLGHGVAQDAHAPAHLPCLSRGQCAAAKAGMLAAGASKPTSYVAPADRYAVVPGQGPNGSAEEERDAKRARMAAAHECPDHGVPGA